MGMSEFYGARDDAESIATIHRALELGVTLLDTSDVYGPLTNEELVGQAIAGRRDEVVLATKFGIVRDPDDPSVRGIDGSPAYVQGACDGSLRRLGVDHIDLYYQHRVDPKTPIEETVGAMAELVDGGQGALPRPLRGGARDHPPGARRAPDLRAADRVFAVDPRPRGRAPADLPRAGHRLRRLQPARPRLPHRRHHARSRTSTPTTAAATRRASRARTSRRTSTSSAEVKRARRRQGRARRPSWPSRGSWPRARRSSRSRAPSAASTWRRTSAPSTSTSPTTTCSASPTRCPRPRASATPRR